MTTFTVIMRKDRETKGARRFVEVDSAGSPIVDADVHKVGTQYIRKHAHPNGANTIRVTVEVID